MLRQETFVLKIANHFKGHVLKIPANGIKLLSPKYFDVSWHCIKLEQRTAVK
jgi:hypothetical protein